jgi:glutamate-1-semialdehyde 2,1-aminomutase
LIHDIASHEWLVAARTACDRAGAVLIFDEVKTAFRIRTGGIQELLGVTPDLTTVGKAFANGYPLAAVVGRAGVMEAANRTWISSTAAAESTGLAAARAVLDWHDRTDVPARLEAAGLVLRDGLQEVLGASNIGVRAEGPPQMFRLIADTEHQLDAFVAAGVAEGVLFKRGAYQFPSLAHDDRVCDLVVQAARNACDTMARSA